MIYAVVILMPALCFLLGARVERWLGSRRARRVPFSVLIIGDVMHLEYEGVRYIGKACGEFFPAEIYSESDGAPVDATIWARMKGLFKTEALRSRSTEIVLAACEDPPRMIVSGHPQRESREHAERVLRSMSNDISDDELTRRAERALLTSPMALVALLRDRR